MVSVLLKQDVSCLMISEVLPIPVLAVSHKSVEHLRVALIFNDLDTIEPMLDMVALDLDPCSVPVLLVERNTFLFGTDQVIERTKCAVALDTEFGIRMKFVVEDLELAADG